MIILALKESCLSGLLARALRLMEPPPTVSLVTAWVKLLCWIFHPARSMAFRWG